MKTGTGVVKSHSFIHSFIHFNFRLKLWLAFETYGIVVPSGPKV